MPGPVLICAQTPEGHQEVRKAGSSGDEGGQGWGDFSLNTSGSIPKLSVKVQIMMNWRQFYGS